MRSGNGALSTRGTNLGQSSNWTTSGIKQHILTVGDSFEIGDGRILIYSSIGVQNSIF